MKIVIFSDSHGDQKSMETFLERLRPEMVMHLGDGIDDIRPLEKNYRQVRFEYVKGNADIAGDVPKEKLISLEGFNFYLTHGDMYDHKNDNEKIVDFARKKKVSLFLHGHTHTPTLWFGKGITVMNPGTVRNKPDMGCPTCGLVYTYKSHFICKILFLAFLPFYTNDVEEPKA